MVYNADFYSSSKRPFILPLTQNTANPIRLEKLTFGVAVFFHPR